MNARIAALEAKAQQHDSANGVLQDEMPPTSVPSVPIVPPPSPAPVPQQPPVPSTPSLDSRVISDVPEIFAEFRKSSLLWRGSRDGFNAKEFHRRCDDQANTLTVILDTDRNIFGGFTPVEWESRTSNYFKADDSLKSFVFTLKNPHNIPARRFGLKADANHQAIDCNSEWGPCFGYSPCDIAVSDNCNTNTDSYTQLGICYANDTGLGYGVVLTGSWTFQVKEIEVFEITD
jgi:hypothetical protein